MELELALRWARLGYKVIPLRPDTKKGYTGWPDHATSRPR